jgi:Ser/Thr protein kinase RdoA (MazF antagonist)
VTISYVKRYPDPAVRQRALFNYAWLAGLEPHVRLPPVIPGSGTAQLRFGHITGRHVLPADLTAVAAHLGGMHGAAHAIELNRARLGEPYRTRAGYTLPGFPDGRADAVARELATGAIPGTPLTAREGQRLITGADGPAAFYKDANPRNFLITPDGEVVTIDFDALTLAPFGYDLAKLIVTLAMTHGPIPAANTAAALDAYNCAATRQSAALPGVAREDLLTWAEIHHILTIRYAADGRYPCRWDQARPAGRTEGPHRWP